MPKITLLHMPLAEQAQMLAALHRALAPLSSRQVSQNLLVL
jgi:hypothetical protein